MAYDLPTRVHGVVARHADACPARDGEPCTCGPIGYRPVEGGRVVGPLMETEAEALAWRREQHSGLDVTERDVAVTHAIDDFVAAAATSRDVRGRRYTSEGLRELRTTLTEFADSLPEQNRHAPEAAMPGSNARIPDEAIWLVLKVTTVVFILIALILAAESI
jgi:hypothetical protein